MIDIPTALTENETKMLQRLAANRGVLEIGALLGYSTVALAQTARYVVSVDPHDGYPENDPRPTWEPYLANLIRYDVFDKVRPIRLRWQDAFKTHDFRFEIAFLDLTGKYEDTRECLEFLNFWMHRPKAIAVHDCGHPDWPGVMHAVNDFKTLLGKKVSYQQVDRLGVLTYV